MANLSDFVEGLSDIERQKIIKVLEKDLELQRREQDRIRQIRSQLNFIRQKSAVRVSTRKRVLSTRKKCARCKEKLGYVINAGNACRRCKQTVCQNCRRTTNVSPDKQEVSWLCVLCHTTREYCAVSGEWFYRKRAETQVGSSVRGEPGLSGAMSDDEPVSDNISVSLTLLGELQKAVRRSWKPIDTIGVPASPSDSPNVKFRDKNIFRRGEPKRRSSRKLGNNRKKTIASMEGLGVDSFAEQRKSSHQPNMSLLSVPSVNEQRNGRSGSQKSPPLTPAGVQRSPSMPGDFQDGDGEISRSRSPRHTLFRPLAAVKAISTGNLFEKTSKMSTRSSGGVPDDDVRSSRDTDVSTEVDSESYTNSSKQSTSAQSITSIYTDSGVEIQGELSLGLEYNCRQGALEVHVIQARGLAPVDVRKNRSNPYVKTYLTPDRSQNSKRKTKVKRHTLEPVFHEILKYSGLTKSELEGKTLFASVWHSDRLGTNTFLGEICISLSDYPWTSQPGKYYWYTLGKRREEPPPDPSHPANYCGELCLSVKFMPPDVTRGERGTGSLHCLVRSVKHLISARPGSIMNVVIKAYLYPDKRKYSKQKSPGVRGLTDMIWNHTFVYPEQTVEDLKHHCLELTLWDQQRLSANEFLGGVRLNLGSGKCKEKFVDWMDGTSDEMMIWSRVLDRPNSWIEASIPLRTSMAPRKY